jgi:hypothetical protein
MAALKLKYPNLPWSAHLPFAIVPMNAPLVDDRALDQNELPGRKRLQAAILAFTAEYGAPPAAIIVDTYSRAIGGSASDETLAGKFANMAGALSTLYGTTTLRIHHPGQSEQHRARGAYAITAGLDVEIRVSEGLIEAPKQRDAEKNKLGFKLEVVNLGKDQDGDRITSCAVVPGPVRNELDLNSTQQAVLSIIIAKADSKGSAARQGVLDACRQAGLVSEEKKGGYKFRDTLKQLAKKERITFDDQEITLLERGANEVFDD